MSHLIAELIEDTGFQTLYWKVDRIMNNLKLMVKNIGLLSIIVLVSACMGKNIVTTVPFDPNEVAFINQTGSAKIEGQAFLRQNGGGVVTCAGTNVWLIPAGQYATERITQIYGNKDGGKVNVLGGANMKNTDPGYLSYMKEATCDAEGDFEFKNVANGDYYLGTSVTWTVGSNIIPEGGHIAKRIEVRAGVSQRIILN